MHINLILRIPLENLWLWCSLISCTQDSIFWGKSNLRLIWQNFVFLSKILPQAADFFLTDISVMSALLWNAASGRRKARPSNPWEGLWSIFISGDNPLPPSSFPRTGFTRWSNHHDMVTKISCIDLIFQDIRPHAARWVLKLVIHIAHFYVKACLDVVSLTNPHSAPIYPDYTTKEYYHHKSLSTKQKSGHPVFRTFLFKILTQL